MDTPCLALAELNRVSDVTHQGERFQDILFVRNDRVQQFSHSLGPQGLYKSDTFRIIDGWIELINGSIVMPRMGVPQEYIQAIDSAHSVGWFLEHADRQRGEPSWVNEFPNRVTHAAWLDQKENERKFLRGHSTFGPGGSTVRNL